MDTKNPIRVSILTRDDLITDDLKKDQKSIPEYVFVEEENTKETKKDVRTTMTTCCNKFSDSFKRFVENLRQQEVLFVVLAIVLCVLDPVSDIILSAVYFNHHINVTASLTLVFVYIPSLINTYLLFTTEPDCKEGWCFKVTRMKILFVPVFIFRLSSLLMLIDKLKFTLNKRKAKTANDFENEEKFEKLVQIANAESLYLRCVEAGLGASLQIILQFTTAGSIPYFYHRGRDFAYCLSLITSLMTVGWISTSFLTYLPSKDLSYKNIHYLIDEMKPDFSTFLKYYYLAGLRILILSGIIYINYQWYGARFLLYVVLFLHWSALIFFNIGVLEEKIADMKTGLLVLCKSMIEMFVMTKNTPNSIKSINHAMDALLALIFFSVKFKYMAYVPVLLIISLFSSMIIALI